MMSGGTKSKNQRVTEKHTQMSNSAKDATEAKANATEDERGCDLSASNQLSLREISAQITGLKSDLTDKWTTFKEDFRSELKEELTQFKLQLEQQLANTSQMLEEQGQKLKEAEARLDEQESWSAVANEAFQHMLKEQQSLQEKLNDMESRSRRANMRIYGVPEGSEGGSVIQFVEKLIINEGLIQEGTDLQIQRAHRSLAPKPGPGVPSRSIIISFLQYKVKETILRNAWRKKIQLGDKILSFDHDYTSEVVQKRKEYKEVKAALKERGIRFQTPFTRMRVHWENGAQIYYSAEEVENDLRQRGLLDQPEVVQTVEHNPPPQQQLQQTSPWQRVPQRRQRDAALRARGRLQEFQRKPKP